MDLEYFFYQLLTIWFSCIFIYLWIKFNKNFTEIYLLKYKLKFEEINNKKISNTIEDKFKFLIFDINYSLTPIGGFLFLILLNVVDFINRILNIVYKKEIGTYPKITFYTLIFICIPLYFIAFITSCILCLYANLLAEKLCVFLFE